MRTQSFLMQMFKGRSGHGAAMLDLSRPVAGGTTLAVRPATPEDLPQGCVWSAAADSHALAREIQDRVIDGPHSTIIWMPPRTAQREAARRFFALTAGQLRKGTWHYQSTLDVCLRKQPESSAFILRDFRRVAGYPDMQQVEEKFTSYSKDDFAQARRELDDRIAGILDTIATSQLGMQLYSADTYGAAVGAMYIHEDGLQTKESDPKGLRVFEALCGDQLFLYDARELQFNDALSKDQRTACYDAKGTVLNAWAPPDDAVVVLSDHHFKFGQINSPHSARGRDYATQKGKRVVCRTDLFLR